MSVKNRPWGDAAESRKLVGNQISLNVQKKNCLLVKHILLVERWECPLPEVDEEEGERGNIGR